MPLQLWIIKYLVLVREELSNYSESRALKTKTTKKVYRFILEDIFSRYSNIERMRIDWGELNSLGAKDFFQRYDVKLKLITTYNLEANDKSERGHSLMINAFIKNCKGKSKQWPRLLSFALWIDRTIHSTITGYMPIELILGQKSIMLVNNCISS